MRKSYKTYLAFEMDMLRDDFLEGLEFDLNEDELSKLTEADIDFLFQDYLEEYYMNYEL